ncbi:Ctf8-domain-containing protein [Mucidula mucida]|nr:Ctf8-domain-containing protein [Mucidula mucida]
MIIPVDFILPSSSNLKLPPSVAKVSHDEIVLVELQGTLDVESTYEGERDGKLVGQLTLDDDLKRPTLRIGHHLLEGKIVTLKKPLAIMHKTRPNQLDDDDGFPLDDSDDAGFSPTQKKVGWQAVAIVKRKVLFAKRPMPIVGKSS